MFVLEDTQEYQMGRSAEARWCRAVVQRYGGMALPVYGATEVDDSTKAPVLFARNGVCVAPDVFYANSTARAWHEVKAKSVPGWYRNLQRYEHGIDYSLYLDYLRVEEETGIPVFIVVHEARTPTVPAQSTGDMSPSGVFLFAALRTVRTRGEHRPTWPGGRSQPWRRGRRGRGGWLWPRDCMVPARLV